MLGGDPGGDAAAPVGQGVLGRPVGQLPAADRPLHVGQVGGHVVAVVPELDPLGVVDADGQPPLGPVVLDQHRAEGGRRVQRGGVVAGDGQAPLAVADGLLEAAVEHVGGGQDPEQGRPHRSGGGVLRDRGQGPLQAAGPGGQVLAEQMGDRDQPGHHRGRSQPVPGPGEQPVGLLVGLEGGGVVVDGGGLVADGGQQGRLLGRAWPAGRLRWARRYRASASRWADRAAASRAAVRAWRWAGPASPACSKWAETKASR